MDDLEFRRKVLSGDTHSPAIEQAAQHNPDRQRWLQQARVLEAELNTGLHHSPPAGLAQRLKQIPDQQQRKRWPLAAAAALVLGIALTSSLNWQQAPALGDELLQHIANEPNTLYNHQPLPPSTVALVAQRLGYRFSSPQTNISYASICAVRGHQAVHLTVQTGQASASVFLMPSETDQPLQQFSHHHLHGRVIPLAHGSAAILSTDTRLLDQLATRTMQQLSF